MSGIKSERQTWHVNDRLKKRRITEDFGKTFLEDRLRKWRAKGGYYFCCKKTF
jgi:hypothetical protein